MLEHNFVMSRMAADSTYGGEDLRKTIDYFCHILRDSGFLKDLEEIDPEYYSKHGKEIGWATKLSNPVFNPTYGDMIRSTFMYKYGRAKTSDLVNLLSGRNFETKTYEEDVVEDSFRRMNEGVSRFVNGYNYRDFLSCIMATGFRDSDQITSSMTADFAYALYLRLIDSGMKREKVDAYVGRWFVMSNLTRRYSNSPESKMDRDLRMIRDKGFERYLEEIEESELSDSFWNSKLVMDLETSRYSNPLFYTFLASQIAFEDKSMLNTGKTVSILAQTNIGDVHHIFPREYLRKNKIPQTKYNQVANYAYIDKATNISISDKSPKEYFGIVKEQCSTKNPILGNITDLDELNKNLESNCIPIEVMDMEFEDYDEFLKARRKLMAARMREYYGRIKSRCGKDID